MILAALLERSWVLAAWGTLHGFLFVTLGMAGVALLVWHCIAVRKRILFEAWVDMTPSQSDLGRRVADLLLFKIRAIKGVHDQAAAKVDLWNPYQDVPAFRQGLDEDIQLLASVELGKYDNIVTKLILFLFRLLPLLLQPDRLKGSVHTFGGHMHYLATLELFGARGGLTKGVRLWEVTRDDAEEEHIPDSVEEMAYRIYLDMTAEETFKSWAGFRAYTCGLREYLRFVDLSHDNLRQDALRHYEEALEIEPNNAVVHYNIGVLHYYSFNKLDNTKALASFRRAIDTASWRLRARAHSALASALTTEYHRFRSGDALAEAIEHGREAVRIDPDLDGAHKGLAFACHQRAESLEAAGGDPAQVHQLRETAIAGYRRAFGCNARHYVAHNNLGNLYLEWAKATSDDDARRERLRLAAEECRQALQIRENYKHAHDNLGNIYYELGQLDEARLKFENALRYDPDYPEARNDLAMLHLEPGLSVEGSLKRALDLHAQALASIPKPEQVKQRAKLCGQFSTRAAGLARAGKLADEEQLWAGLAAIEGGLCACVRPER